MFWDYLLVSSFKSTSLFSEKIMPWATYWRQQLSVVRHEYHRMLQIQQSCLAAMPCAAYNWFKTHYQAYNQRKNQLSFNDRVEDHPAHFSSFWIIFLPPLIRPVLLAAIRPTFLPLDLSRRTVDGWPICWWLPPPWGCSTGFIATPLTLGQWFLFPFCLYQARLALSSGFSVLWPPATTPTIALQPPTMVFLVPDGSLTLVFFPSSEWPIMTAEVPEALANDPLSPSLPSQLETMVPSGNAFTGIIFPTARAAINQTFIRNM